MPSSAVPCERSMIAQSAYEKAAIAARLDRLPKAPFHYRLLAIHGCAWAFDAFDVGLMTFVAAKLYQSWNLGPDQIGLLLSAGLFGMLAGALVAGPLADRFGRKAVFQLTLLVFSLFSLACAYVPEGNVGLLVFFRFLVGLGLGGETPVISSIMSEFVPPRHRGRLQGVMNCFWAVGWLGAAVTAFILIPNLDPHSFLASLVPHGDGWRVAFLVGALPALYVFYIRLSLTESPRWLADRGRFAEARAIVDDIEKVIGATKEIPPVDEAMVLARARRDAALPHKGSSPLLLFRGPYFRRTVVLWILWFCCMAGYHGLFSWLPTLLTRMGHTMSNAFFQIMLMQLFYIPNQIIAAFLMDKYGRKPLLMFNMGGSAICALAYGFALTTNMGTHVVLALGCMTAFFTSAITGVACTYTPEQYPTAVRATGMAWSSAISRVGSMLMPLATGFLVATSGVMPVFGLISALYLLPVLVVGLWGIETRNMPLDEVDI